MSSPTEEVQDSHWRRLSQSYLWQEQREFYGSSGPKAWTAEGGVPSYASSNSSFAEKYVDLLVALSGCGSIPVAVLELGAGSGQLAFLILQIWMERCWRYEWDPNILFYVVTDIAESNIQAYMEHSQLRMHADAGLLDFAQLDVTSVQFPITLRWRQTRWQPHCPTLTIASYLLDSLPLDIVSISSGRRPIRQMLIKRCCDQAGIPYLTKMEPIWNYSELAPELISYIFYRRDRYRSPQAFMLPVTAASVLCWLRQYCGMARIPLVMVIADKGRSTDVELFPAHDPKLPIARHSSFSFPVNFQCVRFVANCLDGYVWESRSDKNMKLMTVSWHESAWVRQAFCNLDILPAYLDMYYIFMKSACSADLSQLLAMFQSSCYDPRLFFLTRDRFLHLLSKCPEQRSMRQLTDAFQLATRRCFALQGAPDFIFELGNALLAVHNPTLALGNYRLSTRLYGYDSVVLSQISLLLLDLRQDAAAKPYLQRAIFINPAYARSWRCLERFFLD